MTTPKGTTPRGTTLPTQQGNKLPLRAIFDATQGPAVLTPTQARAYTALMEAVASHRAQVPCLNRTDLDWLTEDDSETRVAAAAACTGCPAIAQCSAYTKAHRQDAGVWAGRTPGQRGRTRTRKEATRR